MARHLFATQLYEAEIGEGRLVEELAHSIRSFAAQDEAGRRWSREHALPGLHQLRLAQRSAAPRPGVRRARQAAHPPRPRLRRRARPGTASRKLDSLWANLLKSGGHHSGHIHPHSIISGTFYVEAPPGSGAIRFEDPRLPLMMAAPAARPTPSSPSSPAPACCCCGKAGSATKSSPARGKGERLSISFNFA